MEYRKLVTNSHSLLGAIYPSIIFPMLGEARRMIFSQGLIKSWLSKRLEMLLTFTISCMLGVLYQVSWSLGLYESLDTTSNIKYVVQISTEDRESIIDMKVGL